MKQEEANELKHGVYTIYWLYGQKFPYSIGAVGSDSEGDSWFMPVNWISDKTSKDWDAILRVELIEEMDYNYPPRISTKTPQEQSLEPYKIQIHQDSLRIQEYHDTIDLPRLLNALRECGYQITEPPHKSFLEIKQWLDSQDTFQCINATGDLCYEYFHNLRDRTVVIARKDGTTEITILDGNLETVFAGHVLSLEEFKLIWNRVL
jgi:hypothetical protein